MTPEDVQKIKESIRLSRETESLNRDYLSDAVDLVNSIITKNEYNNASTITIDDQYLTKKKQQKLKGCKFFSGNLSSNSILW